MSNLRSLLGLALICLLFSLAALTGGEDTPVISLNHSGAQETFLFIAGMLLAAPLLNLFQSSGVASGLLRIAHRVWQIYWRYLGAVLVSALLVILLLGAPATETLAVLGLSELAIDARSFLPRMALLSAQPGYFSALTIYLMVLALSPIFILLGLKRPELALAASLLLYCLAQFASPSPASWRLDPLAWQALFFFGFAIAAGWLAPPKPRLALTYVAIAVLAASVIFEATGMFGADRISEAGALGGERNLGIARLLRFAALAYLAALFASDLMRRFARIAPWMARRLARIGEQNLVTLVALHPIAVLMSVVSTQAGGGVVSSLFAALCGAALLAVSAETAAWFDAPPWAARPGRESRAR